jgi:hypothetical protein
LLVTGGALYFNAAIGITCGVLGILAFIASLIVIGGGFFISMFFSCCACIPKIASKLILRTTGIVWMLFGSLCYFGTFRYIHLMNRGVITDFGKSDFAKSFQFYYWSLAIISIGLAYLILAEAQQDAAANP